MKLKSRFAPASRILVSASLSALCLAMSPTAHAATAVWNGTAGDWNDGTRWSSSPDYPDNGQPNPGDTWAVTISSGDVNRNISATISSLAFSGGRIYGSGTLTVTGLMTWTGGTLEGSGVYNALGGIAISPSSVVNLNGATLENAAASEAIISGTAAMNFLNGGIYRNSGTTRLRGNNSITNGGGTGNRIENSGTLVRDQGTGSYVIGVPVENSGNVVSSVGSLYLNAGGTITAGTLDATGGAIYLNGGAFSFAGGSLVGDNWVYLTAGTASVDATTGAASGAATGRLALSGGSLAGTAMISAAQGYLVSGQINGDVTIRYTGASTKETNSHLAMNGGTIRNDGTFTNNASGNFDLDNASGGGAGTLDNRGTWTLNGVSTYYNSYGGGQVQNRGVFQVTAGQSNILGAFHHHNGSTLSVTGGSVLLSGGGTMAAGSTIDAQGSAYVYFYGGTHTLNGGTLTGANTTYTGNTATVVVAGDVGAATGAATGGFGVAGSGSTVTGTAMISADHGYLGSGQINGDVTIRYTGASTKDTNTHLGMNGGTIRNDGTLTNNASGNFDLDNASGGGAGTLDNRGTWTLNGVSTYYNSYGGGQVQNRGVFQVTAGQSNILGAFHHHNGSTLSVTGGSVLLSGGGTMAAGSTIDAQGPAYVYFYGGTHTLNGGTLTGANTTYTGNTATVVVAGDVGAATGAATGGFGVAGSGSTVTGTAMISADHGYLGSGQINGDVTIRYTGASTKDTNTHLGMNGGTIRNEGTLTNNASGNFDLDNVSGGGAGMLDNRGTWTLSAGSTYYNTYGGGQLVNYGLFQSTAGNSNILGAVHHKSGSTFRSAGSSAGYVLMSGGGTMEAGATLDADGARYMYFYGGTHTLQGGTLTGSGHTYTGNTATVVVAGNVGAASGAATGGFGMIGGTLAGTAMISADHGYMHSGQINGDVTIRFTGATTKEANQNIGMNGGTLRNEGAFDNLSNGTIDLDNASGGGAGTLDNRGTWTLSAGTTYSNTYGGGQLVNYGLFQSTAGNSNILGAVHHKSGSTFRSAGSSAGYVLMSGGGTMEAGATLDADGARYIYFYGGTHTLNGGTLTGSGHTYTGNTATVVVAGNVGAASGAATGGFGMSSGTVTGTAMISADHGYMYSGQINGSVVIRYTGASTKDANSHIGMNGGTIRNDGSWNNLANGTIDLDNNGTAGAGTLDNRGTWTLSAGTTYSNTYGGGAILNSGTMAVAAGTSVFHAPLTNSGTLRVASGALLNVNSGSSHTGTITADGGVGFGSGTHLVTGVAASVGGTGYITGTLNLASGASLRPGDSPMNPGNVGTLNIYGPVGLGAGSIFSWDLATGSNTYDKLVVNTGAVLSGSNAVFNITSSTGYSNSFWNSGHTWTDIVTGGGTGVGDWTNRFGSIGGTAITWSGGVGTVAGEGYFTLTSNQLIWAPVPELSNLLAGVLLGAGLLRRRR